MYRFGIWPLSLCLLVSVSTAWSANKAGLVIQNSKGNSITRCVEFEEETITVEELLRRSGFRMITSKSSYGTLLHFLHDEGRPDGSAHPDGWFWNFYIHADGGWEMAMEGIGTASAANGSLFGFEYGSWGDVKLPEKTFADVCETVSRAGLVVDHSNGNRTVKVVDFPGETITGLNLLLKSGFSVIYKETNEGIAICSLDSEGQPQNQCLDDPEGRTWGIHILDDRGEWQPYEGGPDTIIVRDKDVHNYLFDLWETPPLPILRQEVFELPSGVEIWGMYWN